MKLVTKIFLQVLVGFLVLSQLLFFYLLYETKQQNLMDVYSYERDALQTLAMEFHNEVQSYDILRGQDKLWDIAAQAAFQKYFTSRGVLYRDGIELYNETAYEFDYEKIFEKKEDRPEQGILGEDEEAGNGNKILVSRVDNQYFLLLFFDMKDYVGDSEKAEPNYQIVWYKDVTDIYERSKHLAWKGLFFTAMILGLMGGIFLYSLKRTMRPLEILKTAAADIADGDYESRVPIQRKDEIGQLAASFNRMAEQIEHHVQQLTQTNASQRQLLAGLAHELKTPMTAIIGYADTLLTVRLQEEQRQKALRYIGSECQRLSRLSAKMMELTGLYETGESRIIKKPVSVKILLEELESLVIYRLKEKDLTLHIRCETEEVTREMDQDLMLSLLTNLVDNACKASSRGQKIEIIADAQKIIVQDHGKGIPKEEIAHVTEAFYMVDKSRAKSEGSIGLGLALCRRIADIHGAMLQIVSEPGQGTQVIFLWKDLQNGYKKREN